MLMICFFLPKVASIFYFNGGKFVFSSSILTYTLTIYELTQLFWWVIKYKILNEHDDIATLGEIKGS